MSRTIKLEDGTEVTISQESYDELKKAVTTYRMGDRFLLDDAEYILAGVESKVVLIPLKSGNYWDTPVSVASRLKITQKEFDKCCGYKKGQFERISKCK